MDRRPGSLPTLAARLRRLVILPVALAITLVAGINLWNEFDRNVETANHKLMATAQVFGSASSRAVARGDSDGVSQVLRGIARLPGLRYAEVRDASGELLADLGAGARLLSDSTLRPGGEVGAFGLLTSRTVEVKVPIVDGGKAVGELLLVSETANLSRDLLAGLKAAALASALALLLGLGLAARLQRQISHPLATLTSAMASSGRQNAYHPVAETGRDRETMQLAKTFNGMVREIRLATDEILARESEIIGRLSRAAEQRDDATGRHIQRVADLSRIIAEGLDLAPDLIADLHRASPMHDVGKLSVPDAILFKPGPLTPGERTIMERHAEQGHAVLSGSRSKLVQLAAEIALTHHERWDGTGYPHRLRGDDIPLVGRITAVADVCDALLSERPYKKAWPLADVRAHLIANAGSHLDPVCVAALISRWAEVTAIYGAAARAPRAEAAA